MPVVKDVPAFAEFLLSIVWGVCWSVSSFSVITIIAITTH